MKDQKTNQVFPAITFMPRALEIDALTDEEARRTADPDETYLDPPPHPMSKEALKQQKQDKKKKEIKEKGHRLKERLATVEDGIDADAEKANAEDDESSSSDSDYDEEYDKKLRAQYEDPRPYVRDRDFARKYALTTHDLLVRYLSKSTAVQLAGDGAFVSSILLQMVLDDTWQLVAELRLELDHLDGDLGAGMLRQLLESYGHTILQNTNWVRATLQDLGEWTKHLAASSKTLSYPADLTEELADLRAELADLANRTEKSITLLTSTMAIAQSTLVIEQTSGINKLTELAFVFIPISFITAVFSMQVRELTETPPRLWIWGVCLAAIVLVTYVIRMVIRSPSFRMFALRCRATALSRYSSTNSATAAKQLSTVGNRAILKFVIAATWAMSLILFVSGLGIVALFVARAGIWLGLIGTAVYFIITRWPDPTVLAVCFVSLPLAVTAWRVAWFWGKEIDGVIIGCITAVANMIERLVPTKDEVEDEDLAMEGVETFARQAIMLVT
jgi:Mg2+ and Co2+ transporter CorA